MSLSKKLYLLTMIIATISMNSYASEKEESSFTKAIADTQIKSPSLLVTYAQQINDTYETISQQCERFYNPVGIFAVSATSAVLGVRKLVFAAIATTAIMHSDLIMGYIQEQMKNIETSNTENNQKISENNTIPATTNQ